MRRLLPVAALLLALASVLGCAYVERTLALREVDFVFDRVSDGRLAGVPLAELRRYEDLSAADLLLLARAVGRDELPLSFVAHVAATNPPDNGVAASVVRLDWTLFVEQRRTVSGTFERDLALQPGTTTDIALPVELDLARFFDGGLRELVRVAIAVAGRGALLETIEVRARPIVFTPLGPIRYPQVIVLRPE